MSLEGENMNRDVKQNPLSASNFSKYGVIIVSMIQSYTGSPISHKWSLNHIISISCNFSQSKYSH